MQAGLIASLLGVTIASPVIVPRIAQHVQLVSPNLTPAPPPKIEAVRPKVHVVPLKTLAKTVPVEPQRELLPPPPVVAKVEPVQPVVPAVEVPRPRSLPKIAHVPEVEQPKAVPAPKFDSKILNEAPGPKAKVVATNTFGGSSAVPTLHNVSPSKVQTGGFGDPNGVPVNAHGSGKPNINAAGSFDLPAGPGYGNGTGGASGLRGTVASAGFGNGVAVQGGGGRGGHAGQGGVQSSGFGSGVAPAEAPGEARRHAASAAAPATTPVSIQSKPTPTYTAEARQLRIEGEVLLNVVFTADGKVHVLTVVRGLGHGLDESAQRAAQGVRFNPAMRDGRPVDSNAILHIVFQLS